MDLNTEINKLLNKFDAGKTFNCTEIKYEEGNFGNAFIELVNTEGIILRFFRDKGEVWSEIGTQKETFLAKDVFHVLQLNYEMQQHNFFDAVEQVLQIFNEEHARFREAFHIKNRKAMKSQITKIEKLRSKQMYLR